MLPRVLLAALCAAALATASAAPAVHLKPFQPAAPAAAPLAGAWKGTFVLPRAGDGSDGKEQVTYQVEVSPGLSTLRVIALPPLSSNPDPYLTPITASPAPADWDGETLKAETRQSVQEGAADITIVKTFTLCHGADARHALFRYEVRVKSSKPHDQRTNILRGEGTLTRVQ
ncbi:MAG: hypothetical protein WCH57_05585 [Verrucomicrobiota bacterium]